MTRKILRLHTLAAAIVLTLGLALGVGPAAAAPSAGEMPATPGLDEISHWLGALQAWWGDLTGPRATAAKPGGGAMQASKGGCEIKEDSEGGDTAGCAIDPDGAS